MIADRALVTAANLDLLPNTGVESTLASPDLVGYLRPDSMTMTLWPLMFARSLGK